MTSDLDRWEKAVERFDRISCDMDVIDEKTQGYNDACREGMPPLLEIARLAHECALSGSPEHVARLDALLRKHTEVREDG